MALYFIKKTDFDSFAEKKGRCFRCRDVCVWIGEVDVDPANIREVWESSMKDENGVFDSIHLS